MKPAWGNPYGLKFRSIGEKSENLFVAEFGGRLEMERALGGSPWMVGKHAVILKEYDEKLKPLDISFDRMPIWVRLLDLPLGWMNAERGSKAMGLLGEVIKMDVHADGKASGPYLRARVGIEVIKPIRRGVLLKTDKKKPPEWFAAQYEKLPFFCFSCGVMGHSEIECRNPARRNDNGKLPYDIVPALRAPEEKKKRLQNFQEAAAESYGSSSSGTRKTKGPVQKEKANNVDEKEVDKELEDDGKSPPKKRNLGNKVGGSAAGLAASKQLFMAQPVSNQGDSRKPVHKRKAKPTAVPSQVETDLILPQVDTTGLLSSAIVPVGRVCDRVQQLEGGTLGILVWRTLPRSRKLLTM